MHSVEPAKRTSQTDPTASWTWAPGGPAFYAYSTNYMADTQAGIIVDVQATRVNRTREVESARTMIERVKHRFTMKPNKLIGDAAYGAADMLGWLVKEKGIAPHVPVLDKSEGTGEALGRSDFRWDDRRNEFICPAGKSLQHNRRKFTVPRIGITKANTINYTASKDDCDSCAMRAQCCPTVTPRRIRVSIHEDARNVARELAKTQAYAESRSERKKVEMLFAHMKRILKVDRLRLRGMSGAHDEFLLTATAQNLRRMARRFTDEVQGMAEAAGNTSS